MLITENVDVAAQIIRGKFILESLNKLKCYIHWQSFDDLWVFTNVTKKRKKEKNIISAKTEKNALRHLGSTHCFSDDESM